MDLAIPFPSNFWPLIPNPASVFVLHVRISRKVTSKFGKFAFSTLLGALPCPYRGSQNFSKAWNTSPDIYSEIFSIKNPPKNSFFARFAINSTICHISIVITETNYNGNTTYCRIYGKWSEKRIFRWVLYGKYFRIDVWRCIPCFRKIPGHPI